MKNRWLVVLTLLVGAGLLFGGLPATHAQTDDESKDEEVEKKEGDKAVFVLEEITVTATKRESDLMLTPIGIGAVTSDQVERVGAVEMGDVFRMVSAVSQGGEATSNRRYSIRGMTSQQNNSVRDTAGSTVAVYLDDASLTSALGPARQITGNMFDIERVEILKGPQGTLFGEGAQAGAIRFIYKEPDLTEIQASLTFGTSVEMSHSEDHSFRADGLLNMPLIQDRLAARLSLFKANNAGWIDQLSDCTEVLFEVPVCQGVDKDVNGTEHEGGRLALKYSHDRFSITGRAYWVRQQGIGTMYTPVDTPLISDHRKFGHGVQGDGVDEYQVYSLSGDVDLGFATLTSITTGAFRESFVLKELFDPIIRIIDWSTANGANDAGRCLLEVEDPDVNCPVPIDGANQEAYGWDGWNDTERFTQDVRLVSNIEPGSRWRWTAGAYYKTSKDWSWSGTIRVMSPGREVYAPLYFFWSPETSHETEFTEQAIYGEVSYQLTETLEATAGARYSKLEQDFMIGMYGARIANESKVPTPEFSQYAEMQPESTGSSDDSPFSPKFVLSWMPKTLDLMGYFSFSSGFRPGNQNRQNLLQARNLERDADSAEQTGGDPDFIASNRALAAELRTYSFYVGDTVYNYELGVKATLFDGRAQVQTAAYLVDWQDIIQRQRIELTNGDLLEYNDNEGAAEVKGIDLDVKVLVTDGLQVSLSAAFISTELTEARNDYVGNELIFTSPWSGTIALDYDVPVFGQLLAGVHLDHSQYDKQWLKPANFFEIPSYHITNARVSLGSMERNWSVTLWAKNLTDETIMRDRLSDLTWQNPDWFWGSYAYYLPPRSIGVDFSWHF